MSLKGPVLPGIKQAVRLCLHRVWSMLTLIPSSPIPLPLCFLTYAPPSLPVSPLSLDFAKYGDVPSDEWLDGKVVSIMNYGAFVRLEGGVDGMVHISQMGAQGQRIDSVYNAVQVRRPWLGNGLAVSAVSSP